MTQFPYQESYAIHMSIIRSTLYLLQNLFCILGLCRLILYNHHQLRIGTILTAVILFPREARGRRVEWRGQGALRPAVLGSFIPRESFAVGKFGASFPTFARRVGLEQRNVISVVINVGIEATCAENGIYVFIAIKRNNRQIPYNCRDSEAG